MNWLDFVALILAADACATVYFFGGGPWDIFDKLQSYFYSQAKEKGEMSELGRLFTCLPCLSFHIPYLLALAFLIPAYFSGEPWNYLFKLPLYSLAATDLIYFLQQIRPWESHDHDYDEEDDEDVTEMR